MSQHASISLQSTLVHLSTSTELFNWAARNAICVQALVLEEVVDVDTIILREAVWTEAAHVAKWLLPAVERWGERLIPDPTECTETAPTYGLPDFSLIDISTARPVSEFAATGLRHTKKRRRKKNRLAETRDAEPATNPYSVRLLINPANHCPFYVGLTRPLDGLLEPGSGREAEERENIFLAANQREMRVYAVSVEEAATYEAAKHAKQYWIGLLLHSHGSLINNEVKHASQQRAVDLHLGAIHSHGNAGIRPLSPREFISTASDTGQREKIDPPPEKTRHKKSSAGSSSWPARNGKRWEADETTTVKAMYLEGHDIASIAKKFDRTPRSIEIKLATLAENDAELTNCLQLDVRLNSGLPI